MSDNGDKQDHLDDILNEDEQNTRNNDNDDDQNDEHRSKSRSRENERGGNLNKEVSTKRVFVGNLAFKTKWQGLKDHMRGVGNVTRVDIFEDRDGQSKGFGLVEFETTDEAQKAISEMNKTTLDGRQIFVREDDPKQGGNRPPRPNRDNRDNRDRRERRRSRSRSNRRRSYSRSESYDRDRKRKSRRDRRSRSRSSSRSSSRSRSRSRRRSDKDSYKNRRRDRSGSRERRRSRDRDNRKGSRDGVEVVVKNMPWSVTWQQLKDAFREYGNVLRAEVPQDDQGRSKGFGYVRFEKEKEALKAKDGMDGAAFNGRKIYVRMNENN